LLLDPLRLLRYDRHHANHPHSSGGQTGADRGGLEAALYCKIPHGGWCPKGRKAEDRRIPDKYELTEMSTSDYLARTEANVVDSDATVVFTEKIATGGSLRTLEYCTKHQKPWHHVCLATASPERIVKDMIAWLRGDPEWNDYEDYKACPPEQCVLNVAGSRESKCAGIADAVEAILVDVISELNGMCVYPMAKSSPISFGS